MPNTVSFPVVSSVESWKPLVASVLREIAVVLVRTPDIDQAIQDLSGFPGWDHWGMIQTPNGEYPKGRRDMSFAVSRLRDEGLVESPKRGSFILTGNLPVTEPTVTEPTVTEVGKVPVEGNLVSISKSERPSNHPILEEDGDLLVRFVTRASCFGAWKEGDRQCAKCPMAGSCFDAVPVRMASIEQELYQASCFDATRTTTASTECEENSAPHPSPIESSTTFASASAFAEADDSKIQGINGAKIERVGFPVFCRQCNTPVPPNMKFVRWTGPKEFDSPLLAAGNYHVHCFSNSL